MSLFQLISVFFYLIICSSNNVVISFSIPTPIDIISPTPIISLSSGQIQGIESNGVSTFYSIPYGEPPIGNLRLAFPQPNKSWNGVLQTVKPPSSCLQLDSNMVDIIGSEDCLYLNVFVPSSFLPTSSSPTELLPVMFW